MLGIYWVKGYCISFFFPQCFSHMPGMLLQLLVGFLSNRIFQYRPTSLYCTLLHTTNNRVFLYKLKVCGNPVLSKSIGTIFPMAFAHFMSLCHSLVILTILQTFSSLLCVYRDLFSVILDVIIVIIQGHRQPLLFKMNLIDKSCAYSDCFTSWLFPVFLLFLRPPYSLRHNNIEIRPMNNPTMASKCSSARKCCCLSLLNPRLEMIKLSEEGMSKAELC